MTSSLDPLKFCRGCASSKAPTDFHSDKTKSDGLSTRCKACKLAQNSTPAAVARALASKRRKYAENPARFNAKTKAWYEANKEKNFAAAKAWAKANPEKRAEIQRNWQEKNAASIKAKAAAYYLKNKERMNARNKAYIAKPEKYARMMERTREWQAKNPHVGVANGAKRRSAKLRSQPSWANEFFMAEAYRLAKLRDKVCGGKWHVDHIVPLRSKTVCGLHVESNLQVIPATTNMRKGNRHWPDMP